MEEEQRTYEMFAANSDDIRRLNEKDKEHKYRNKFERDRDRILYSKEFRRLSGKTQVFVTGFDDHVRTRLTHTLEVSQITKTICKELKLNEDLGEAIAIGHDIGHTPFGHIGERTLNYIMTGCDDVKGVNTNMNNKDKGFKHNWQGLRVVMDLEKISDDYNGLNLTPYTLWGILNHSNTKYKSCYKHFNKENVCGLRRSLKKCDNSEKMFSLDFYNKYKKDILEDAWTVEALIVRQADEIAQRHHDIEDALEANIIDRGELINRIEGCFCIWLKEGDWANDLKTIKKEKDEFYFLPKLSTLIVDFLTTQFIYNLKKTLDCLIKEYDIKNKLDFFKLKSLIYRQKSKLILEEFSYEESLKNQDERFQEYLRDRILNSYLAQSMDGKANFIIRQLIKAYVTNPQQLQDKTIFNLYRNYLRTNDWDYYKGKSFRYVVGELRNKLNNDYFNKSEEKFNMVLLRTICDYIAGMTDNYAIEQYSLLYGSKNIGQI